MNLPPAEEARDTGVLGIEVRGKTANGARSLDPKLILTRETHQRIAAGLAPLLNLQLRAIETTDLERRLAEMEKAMAKAAVKPAEGLDGGKDAPPPDLGASPLNP